MITYLPLRIAKASFIITLFLITVSKPCFAEFIDGIQDSTAITIADSLNPAPAVSPIFDTTKEQTTDKFRRHHLSFGGGATQYRRGPQSEFNDSAGGLSDFIVQYRYSINRNYDIVADARTYGNALSTFNNKSVSFGGNGLALGLRYNCRSGSWIPFFETDAMIYSSWFSNFPSDNTPPDYKNKLGICAKTGIQINIYKSLFYQFELLYISVATPKTITGYGIGSCFGLNYGETE